MARRKDKVDFTTASQAQDYIHRKFPEFVGPPTHDTISKNLAFIEQNGIELIETDRSKRFQFEFDTLVQTAKELSNQKDKGNLLTDGESNIELDNLIKATERYLKIIEKLKVSTKKKIDNEYIKDSTPYGKDKIFVGEHTFPIQASDSSKTNQTVHLGVLIEILSKVKKYCQNGKSNWGGRDASDFKKMEWLLAQEYQNAGRKISEYSGGEFAQVLEAFYLCSNIKEYNSIKIDNKYIRRIKKEANKNWKTQWRIDEE